jgi:hypothetical protein
MSDKVKVTIQNWGYEDYKPGDTAEVPVNLANMMIAQGTATPDTSKAKASPS